MNTSPLFYLTNILFEGPIPSTIGNLSNLLGLYLSSNKLNGELTSSICNLSSLRYFLLSNNTLEGRLPQCFGNFIGSVQIFHLNMNHLSGLIPSNFTKGCNVISINLGENKFHERLPESLINCRSLRSLDIGNNRMQGEFPFWMGGLPNFKVLVLRSNKFGCNISLHQPNSHFLSYKFWISHRMHLLALYQIDISTISEQ